MTRTVQFSRATILWGLAGLLAGACVYGVLSDTLTMTAYYPAPNATYQQLLSAGAAFLAYQNGAVGIGTKNPATGTVLDVEPAGSSAQVLFNAGKVGVGNPNPAYALDINGVVNAGQGLKMGNVNGACNNAANPANTGVIGYNTDNNAYQYCDGAQWRSP